MPIVPTLALSGQFDGPSESKFACASVQALWPSAASGLIVTPGGRVTVTPRSSDWEGFSPSGCGTSNLRLSPEAESASSVVRVVVSTGLKPWCSQPVTGSYSEVAVDQVPGSW